MPRVALVSCVKQKCDGPVRARDLYTSPLFRAMRGHAETHADAWYILSAKYGLLGPDDPVERYEQTLNTMSAVERDAWAKRVEAALAERLPAGAEVLMLAGARYREHLVGPLRRRGHEVTAPLEHHKLGEQLQWFAREQAALGSRATAGPTPPTPNAPDVTLCERRAATPAVANATPADAIERFYQVVDRLRRLPGQGSPLGSYAGKHPWPARGVYFFFEPGERRSAPAGAPAGGHETPRVVRVGTHAVSAGSKATLSRRLHAHRGSADGGGNHRGSVFRRHVGAALRARDGLDLPTWGAGASAPKAVRVAEATHERAVSAYLAAMPVVWIDVPDAPGTASARAVIERGAVALLSNELQPADPPSAGWLGRHSPEGAIRASGLWNVKFVRETVDPAFLECLEAHVDPMCS